MTTATADVLARLNVREHGDPGAPPMLFAHGFGCDQAMWRYLWPDFADDFHVVLFDHSGHGGSDYRAFDPGRYRTLDGYATDVLAICDALTLTDVTFVGHSVSAMIGVLAANRDPDRFRQLVMIGPSPRYIDDGDYIGGFSAGDIEGLLDALDSNLVAWSGEMAPVIMGNADREELGEELRESFCATDPAAARQFARTTFTSDNRTDLAAMSLPALVLQCADDVIAPRVVGEYVAAHLPDAMFVQLQATGHCPNLSAPAETSAAIRAFVTR